MVAWGNVIIVRTRVQRPILNVTTKADTNVYSVDIYVNETKENLKLGKNYETSLFLSDGISC